VVTHLTTNPPVKGLSCGERTGSRVFLCLWSYVAGSGILDLLLAEKIPVVVVRKDSAWAVGTKKKKLIVVQLKYQMIRSMNFRIYISSCPVVTVNSNVLVTEITCPEDSLLSFLFAQPNLDLQIFCLEDLRCPVLIDLLWLALDKQL
jgi:hypothetical protein